VLYDSDFEWVMEETVDSSSVLTADSSSVLTAEVREFVAVKGQTNATNSYLFTSSDRD